MATSFKKLLDDSTGQTSLTDIYLVDGSAGEIKMTLGIGAAMQKSLSKIKLGKTILLDEHEGSIKTLSLGTNASVKGKFLNIKTVVIDIKGLPNETSLDLNIMGGPGGKFNCKLSKTVLNDGDSVFYEIEIFFFN